ncbi:MAG: hypothetical protein K6G28_03360, partial [Acholeplasmatales bacterium]|nr:hypothetical protein [Acholeplasmatales bacterium]
MKRKVIKTIISILAILILCLYLILLVFQKKEFNIGNKIYVANMISAMFMYNIYSGLLGTLCTVLSILAI